MRCYEQFNFHSGEYHICMVYLFYRCKCVGVLRDALAYSIVFYIYYKYLYLVLVRPLFIFQREKIQLNTIGFRGDIVISLHAFVPLMHT